MIVGVTKGIVQASRGALGSLTEFQLDIRPFGVCELTPDASFLIPINRPRAGRVVRSPNVHRTFTPSLVAEALAKASQLRPGGELFEDIFRINEYTLKRITI